MNKHVLLLKNLAKQAKADNETLSALLDNKLTALQINLIFDDHNESLLTKENIALLDKAVMHAHKSYQQKLIDSFKH